MNTIDSLRQRIKEIELLILSDEGRLVNEPDNFALSLQLESFKQHKEFLQIKLRNKLNFRPVYKTPKTKHNTNNKHK